MRATTLTAGPLATASANNICMSQTPSAAFTLNGSTVASGVATLDTPRRVLFTFVDAEAGKLITIIGTTWGGTPVTEVLTAVSASTAYTAMDFLTITSIRTATALAGAVTVGTNGIGSSRWMRLDEWAPAQATVQATVTGTVNYSLQTAMQDPNSATDPVLPYLVTWMDSLEPMVVGSATSQSSYFTNAPRWVKATVNSGSGSVSVVVAQNSVVPR